MPEDRDEEQQETYHKVDRRIGHRDDEASPPPADAFSPPPAGGPGGVSEASGDANGTPPNPPAGGGEHEAEAEMPAEEALPEDAIQIDMHGILRMVFGMCVEQAWVHLGLQLPPGAQETKMDLAQARLAIDTIAYIKQALGDTLSAAEQREVDQTLTTLRMNFVQRS